MGKRSSGIETWFVWTGRVVIAFGAGLLVRHHFPSFGASVAWPAVAIGLAMILMAAKLLRRPS
jgi:hypothetical protein